MPRPYKVFLTPLLIGDFQPVTIPDPSNEIFHLSYALNKQIYKQVNQGCYSPLDRSTRYRVHVFPDAKWYGPIRYYLLRAHGLWGGH